MKKHLHLLACLLVLMVVAACSSDKDDQGAGSPTLTITSLDQHAHFGDKLPFEVNVSDQVPLSTLVVRLYYGDNKVAEESIRTKENGSYSGHITIPFLKDIPDGTARLEFTLTNTSVTHTTQTADLALSRPQFPYLILVTATDTYAMTPIPNEPNGYSVSKSFPSTELPAYFKAPAVGQYGQEITFGWDAGQVQQGTTEVIPLYSTKSGEFAVTFNTLSYQATPFFEVYVNKQKLAMMDKNNLSADIEFKQGDQVSFSGTADLSTWWMDPDFFTKNGDTYTFAPISGKYRVIANIPLQYFRVQVMSGDNIATLQDDGSGAVWIIGNNIGKPEVSNNEVGWNPDNALCMAPIGDKKYQVTLTGGKQVQTDAIDFKFFHQKGYPDKDKGGEFKSTSITTTSDLVAIGDGTGGHGDGNLYLKDGVTLESNATYLFTVDVSKGKSKAVLTVTKQ